MVTPTLDGDILAVLALVEVAFTPRQLHGMLSRHSEDGIRRALRRLTSPGIVSDERAGNAYLYRRRRDPPTADPDLVLATRRQTCRDEEGQTVGGERYT